MPRLLITIVALAACQPGPKAANQPKQPSRQPAESTTTGSGQVLETNCQTVLGQLFTLALAERDQPSVKATLGPDDIEAAKQEFVAEEMATCAALTDKNRSCVIAAQTLAQAQPCLASAP